jgi:hypothetical protein
VKELVVDLRHCSKTNAMRNGLHPLITDAIVVHGDRKKDVKSLYLAINDADLVRKIDRLTFDHGRTEIWEQNDRGLWMWSYHFPVWFQELSMVSPEPLEIVSYESIAHRRIDTKSRSISHGPSLRSFFPVCVSIFSATSLSCVVICSSSVLIFL